MLARMPRCEEGEAGEGGTIPAPAAIISAVEDALAPFGVTIAECPITPARIVELIAEAGC